MSDTAARSVYLMGHTEHERRRLALQASVLNPLTRGFLERAGLAAGMRVLDIGCGIGEVSLIAAAMVGPHGHVTGLDLDPQSLDLARARARESGYDHVTFTHSSIDDYRAANLFDAVIGRHILIHTPNPLAVLRWAASILHTGGIVAFQEYDLSRSVPPYPQTSTWARANHLIVQLFSRATPHADIGIRLFHLMLEAGFPEPQGRAEAAIDGGPDSPFFEWFAETLRSLLPRMEALGITTAAELNVDSLAYRMRAEAVSARSGIVAPTMVGIFARKP